MSAEPAVNGKMKLTPTQTRFMRLLGDGEAHPRADLIPLLDDEYNVDPISCITSHLFYLSKRIRPYGYDLVVREITGRTWVRLVRHLLPEDSRPI